MEIVAYSVIYAMTFLFGICIGSFLNVLIYRIPLKINIAKGRSFCPSCNNTLLARDMVPLISYIFLRGRCRFCKSKISGRYPLVELIGGIAFVASVMIYGITWQALIVFATICILVTVAFIDIDTMEIPNELVIALIVPALVTLVPILNINEVGIISKVIGFFAIAVPMILMNLIIEGSFGGGDIKLVAVCGFMLGWQNILLATFIALITGGIYAVYLMATKKKTRKQHFAFGPFLSLGIIVALYFGPEIINNYLSLFSI